MKVVSTWQYAQLITFLILAQTYSAPAHTHTHTVREPGVLVTKIDTKVLRTSRVYYNKSIECTQSGAQTCAEQNASKCRVSNAHTWHLLRCTFLAGIYTS